ncbi:MAG: lamin tail domain-containing protein [Candidatus Izemoplasmatales bacterium]|jgi:beta-lactam-binding protein with PASTA domain/endonuclease YncB( thermonuclease family)|nr:lamin tail domain-containing protein [Candidatus Izemoplasmatales bacterium]
MILKKSIKLFILIISVFVIISCGNTTEPTTLSTNETSSTIEEVFLPDLSGEDKETIISEMDNLGLSYTIIYETNTETSENNFIRYEGDFSSGDSVTESDDIVIVIATPYYVLPDFAGMTQTEIFTVLLAEGITFSFELEVNNDVLENTFSSYGNDLMPGQPFDEQSVLIVYIAFNETKLPDLTGKLKFEIEKILTEEQISYEFEYIVNDDFAEDLFIGYENAEIGDIYNDETVTINLYKNTFTDNPTSLMFSKYIDGGDDTSDQAIEIYNATDLTISLGDYHVVIFTNGSYEVSYRIDLDDEDLAPGATYLITNKSSTSATLLREANSRGLITEDLVFDGNDTIQLRYKNDTYIDSIYHIGNRDFVMDNEVYIRKPDVVKGVRNYVFTQWISFIPTYFEIVGTHPVDFDITEGPTFTLINRGFDDPLGGMDSVTLVSINDGDTASFTPGFLDNERVRFLGVDTPETYPVADLWGPEAKAYTTQILNSAIGIFIQSDPDLGYTETYGRHLGLVWVNLGEEGITIDILSSTGQVMRTEHLSGWILLNYHLVLNGYSYNYYGSASTLVFDNRLLYRWFQDAQLFAASNGLGIHE